MQDQSKKVRSVFEATVAMAPTVQMAAYTESKFTYGERRRTGPLTIAIILLVHGILLWMLISHTMFFEKTRVRGGGAIAYLTPMAISKPGAKAKRPPPKSVKQEVQLPHPNAPRQVLVHNQPPAPTITAQSVTAPEVVTRREEPPEDMMAQIEARRRMRAAQQAANGADQEESEGARADRIARANIARAVGAGQDREDTGGLFEIRNPTFHSTEIRFRGWNTNFKRTWSQVVKVEVDGDSDLEVAVVKKMIEIIRQHKTEDFVWESHRLGRNVTLSARPRDTLVLQNFLLHEFYPNHPSLTGKS